PFAVFHAVRVARRAVVPLSLLRDADRVNLIFRFIKVSQYGCGGEARDIVLARNAAEQYSQLHYLIRPFSNLLIRITLYAISRANTMRNCAFPRTILTKFTIPSHLFLKYLLTRYIIHHIILLQTQKRGGTMSYPISSSLLDGIVLAVVERESTYGYRITQDVQKVLDISESTLYPVLRRLQKDGCLTTYDEAFAGRN